MDPDFRKIDRKKGKKNKYPGWKLFHLAFKIRFLSDIHKQTNPVPVADLADSSLIQHPVVLRRVCVVF